MCTAAFPHVASAMDLFMLPVRELRVRSGKIAWVHTNEFILFFVRHLLHSNACTFSLRINDSEMLSCDMDI